jgi:hypothetical protein
MGGRDASVAHSPRAGLRNGPSVFRAVVNLDAPELGL